MRIFSHFLKLIMLLEKKIIWRRVIGARINYRITMTHNHGDFTFLIEKMSERMSRVKVISILHKWIIKNYFDGIVGRRDYKFNKS